MLIFLTKHIYSIFICKHKHTQKCRATNINTNKHILIHPYIETAFLHAFKTHIIAPSSICEQAIAQMTANIFLEAKY